MGGAIESCISIKFICKNLLKKKIMVITIRRIDTYIFILKEIIMKQNDVLKAQTTLTEILYMIL